MGRDLIHDLAQFEWPGLINRVTEATEKSFRRLKAPYMVAWLKMWSSGQHFFPAKSINMYLGVYMQTGFLQSRLVRWIFTPVYRVYRFGSCAIAKVSLFNCRLLAIVCGKL